METNIELAAMFKALGDPTRLHIFDFLRRCCCPVSLDSSGGVRPAEGPTAGEICCHLTGADKINSTISHHLKELRLAGLVTVERRGKNMICGIKPEAATAMAAFLAEPAGGSCCEPVCCEPGCCSEAANR